METASPRAGGHEGRKGRQACVSVIGEGPLSASTSHALPSPPVPPLPPSLTLPFLLPLCLPLSFSLFLLRHPGRLCLRERWQHQGERGLPSLTKSLHLQGPEGAPQEGTKTCLYIYMYIYYVSGMRGCFEWSFMQSLLRLPFSLLLLSFHFRSPTFPFRCRQKSLSLAKWSPFAYPDLSSPPFSSILANLPSWIPPSRKGASCRYVSVYAFIPLHPSRPLALRFLSQGSKRRAGVRLESSEAPHSLRQTTFPLPPLLPSSPSPHLL